MASGNTLQRAERERIELAVENAESTTGLQFLVYVGKSERDTRAQAKQLLLAQGYGSMPGVLVFVAPRYRTVEIVTSDMARHRISDQQAARSVQIMLPAFRQHDWISGLELGLAALAEGAGPPPPGETPGEELPNVL